GKGITAGYLPLAATLTTQEIFDAFLGGVAEHKTFYHGHTYTGNALGCAAALASLNLFEQNQVLESLPGKIELVRQYFSKVAELPFVGDARQCGLMGGIEIVKDKASKESFPFEWRLGVRLCSSMRAEGVMLRPLGDCVVVMPPIAIDLGLLEKLLGIMYRAVKNELPGIIESCDAD
ncbi:MAG: aminotransferase class III-fold pyridoxal phosphate-dependent enzyme, partial [Planctomycetota bacterium]